MQYMEKDEWPEKKDSLKKMEKEKELVNNSSIQKAWVKFGRHVQSQN